MHTDDFITDFSNYTRQEMLDIWSKTGKTFVVGNTGIILNPHFVWLVADQTAYTISGADMKSKHDIALTGSPSQIQEALDAENDFKKNVKFYARQEMFSSQAIKLI